MEFPLNDKKLLACSGLGCFLPAEWGVARNVIELAARSLEGIRIVEVKEFDMKVEKGKVVEYRTKLRVTYFRAGKELKKMVNSR